MKRLMRYWLPAIILLGIVLVLVFSVMPESVDPTIPRLEPTLVDFGEMDQLTEADASFDIINPTDNDLTIQTLATTCTCTVAEIQTPVVLPAGEKITVPVHFETQRKSGRRSDHVTVVLQKHGAIDEPMEQFGMRFQLSAFIRPEVWTNQMPLRFDPIDAGTRASSSFSLFSRHDEYQIVRVESSSRHVQPLLTEAKFNNGVVKIPLALDLRDATRSETLTGVIEVGLEGGRIDRIDVPFSGKVQSPMTVRPDRLVFTRDNPAELTFMLELAATHQFAGINAGPGLKVTSPKNNDSKQLFRVSLDQGSIDPPDSGRLDEVEIIVMANSRQSPDVDQLRRTVKVSVIP